MIFNKGQKEKKEALLEELAKEDLRVLALAYMYAKNLQMHGVDITKPISNVTVNAAIWNNAYQEGYYDAMNNMRGTGIDEGILNAIQKKRWR